MNGTENTANPAQTGFHARRPQSALAADVELLWHYSSPALAHPRERVLPNGSAQLIVNLRSDAFSIFTGRHGNTREQRRGTLFVGPRSESTLVETDQPVTYVGAVFAPGGASRFVHCPLRDLRNEELEAATLWGARADEWRHRLLAAHTIGQRISILEAALVSIHMPHRSRHPAVQWALRELARPHAPPLSELVDKLGYSARHFIDIFSSEVGLPPKQYQRLQRFQSIAQRMHSGRIESLATAALDCGYYDQPHFSHDFRAFAGMPPSAYLARRTSHHNHVCNP